MVETVEEVGVVEEDEVLDVHDWIVACGERETEVRGERDRYLYL